MGTNWNYHHIQWYLFTKSTFKHNCVCIFDHWGTNWKLHWWATGHYYAGQSKFVCSEYIAFREQPKTDHTVLYWFIIRFCIKLLKGGNIY